MNWAARQHPVEAIVEWIAPIPLALAVGWAGWRLGLSSIECAAAGVAALTAGFAALRLSGRNSDSGTFAFEPGAIEELTSAASGGQDVAVEAVLELEDVLVEVAPDSRVVQLFAASEPTPGELVDRIADFLGEAKRPMRVVSNESTRAADASEALQAALANIRASLR